MAQNVFPALVHSAWAATRVLAVSTVAVLGLALLMVVPLRFLDPWTSTFMVREHLSGQAIVQRWRPLNRISSNLRLAVTVSEDAGFCRHHGVEFPALEAAHRRAVRFGLDAARGASTIPMQVAKNLFLWREKSLLRKGLEIPLAMLIDLTWPKRRILEVYLNITEFGPGIFGAEAAARTYFGKPASRLTRREAALLAVTLPNPSARRPNRPSRLVERLARRLLVRMNRARRTVACISTR